MAMTLDNPTVTARSRMETETNDPFETAFTTHWSRVCRTLYQIVGDWDDAEDLALEVFSQLHAHCPQDDQKLASWLYRVATNLGLNALRSAQRRRRYEEAAEILELQQAISFDPASEVERREEQFRVRQVLARMDRRAAQLLVLRHSGLSYVEIAAALNLAPGSIGTLLARAEKEFERRYRAQEGIP